MKKIKRLKFIVAFFIKNAYNSKEQEERKMNFIYRIFIKDYKNIEDPKVKTAYGKVSSAVGIFLNIILFAIKFMAGTIFHSVSIRADAFNNLSDAGSSIISFASFIFSSRPADEEHPFGHERLEYICSLVVSLLILLFSYELITSSVEQILHPTTMKFNLVMVLALLISISVKLFMYYYNTKYGKMINSSVMRATALDSISDVLATSAVLIALLISYFTGIQLDGFMGIVVALFIAKSGIDIIRDTMDEILGEAPDPVYIKTIVNELMSYEGVLGVHDLVVHSYGSNKTFITAHAEVSAHEDILVSHDLMDVIEKDFKKNKNIDLVIHMDPIDVDDPFTNDLRERTKAMVKNIDPALSMHDFRVVKGFTHNNLIFDVVVPFHFNYSNEELLEKLREQLPQNEDGPINLAVITLDTAYVSTISES